MSTTLVLGAGLMGPAIVHDLLDHDLTDHVIISDLNSDRVAEALKRVKATFGPGKADRCEGVTVDLRDREALIRVMRRADVVAGAYPVAAVREVTEAAIEAGTHLCDLTGSAEGFDVFAYHERAERAGVTILPGCGVAPGLTNALTGQAAARLDQALEGVIYVGGLPAEPRPPLDYRVVFALETVIDEYVAPALVIRGGVRTPERALDGLEEIVFPDPVGRCEAFYTYGLGTLAWTGSELGFVDLAEKTVRYPGHRDKILFLRDCGFFGDRPVDVDGRLIEPRRFTTGILAPLLERGGPEDITVLRVVVKGRTGARADGWVFEMVDTYDHRLGETSMARTTGYTCSIVAGMLLDGRISVRGVAPLERVFAAPDLFRQLLDDLRRRGMTVTEGRLGEA